MLDSWILHEAGGKGNLHLFGALCELGTEGPLKPGTLDPEVCSPEVGSGHGLPGAIPTPLLSFLHH